MTATMHHWDRRATDRLFFTGMAVVCLLTMLVGFAPSYFLRSASLPPLSTFYHVHGFIFTLWIVLFLAQTALVTANRTDIHRRVGVAGVGLAFIVFVVGVTASIETLRRGGGTLFAKPHEFFSIPLGDMISFAALVAAAAILRRRADAHKRLMLLATIAILTAAIARFLIQINLSGVGGVFLGTDVLVLILVLYDFATLGRIHPASLWGGAIILVFKPLLFAVSGTPAWEAFAEILR
jgi:hypothetical protein